MRLKGGTATHVGLVREVNQDRCLFSKGLAVVADGMGGHAGGEIAASLAIAELSSVRERLSLKRLESVVQAANGRVFAASASPELRGMGTTLVAASMSHSPGLVQVLNVGDSRCYLVSGSETHQITVDHSLVEDMVRQGSLDPAEARSHPKRNIVTRVLGIAAEVDVDTFEVPVRPGDRLVLCSDGLSNEVSDERIGEVAARSDDPEEIASQLVSEALEGGGRDNITVVVTIVVAETVDSIVEVETQDPEDLVQETVRKPRRWRLLGAVVLLVVLASGAFFGAKRYSDAAWYVSHEAGEVVIYEGRPGGFLIWDPAIVESTGIGLNTLDDASVERLDAETVWPSLESAEILVKNLVQIQDDKG